MRWARAILPVLLSLTGEARSGDVSTSRPVHLIDALVVYASGEDLRALDLLLPHAKHQDALAQFLLARLYLHSSTVPRDCAQGTDWLIRSMNNGSRDAAYEVGKLLVQGHCFAKSGRDALTAFLQANVLDHADAPRALGELYLGAHDIVPDHGAAMRWFRKGASMFDYDSCYQLGLLHFDSPQIATNYREAYKWLDIAVSLSFSSIDRYERALGLRDSVREQLSPSEVTAAGTDAEFELREIAKNNRRRRAGIE